MRLTLTNYVLTHNMSSNLMNCSLHSTHQIIWFRSRDKAYRTMEDPKGGDCEAVHQNRRSDSCIKRAFYRTKRRFIFLSTKPNYWWNSELSYCPEGRRKEGIKKEKACLRRKRSAQIQILALESTLLRDVVDL